MKTVKHLLQTKGKTIHHISPEASVYAALELMAEQNIGAVIVCREDSLVGIFTERDYARKLVLQGKTSHQIAVGEVMTTEVIHVTPRQTLSECMAIMNKAHIRHLPVLEHERLVGLISIRDVGQALISDLREALDRLEQSLTGAQLLD
ncbi:MAG TPA: CBS domain-containing protein [Anaerolineales bacterium]|nr:CBS domain-containing protein [Anaerolineales bacterium]